MSDRTGIEWTDATWNPATGCTKASLGCKHCYAERDHEKRHRAYRAGKHLPVQYALPFSRLQTFPERLDIPRHWRKPRLVFVCSTSDLFHEALAEAYVQAVFRVMVDCPRHVFQVLTKRPERAALLAPSLPWPPNVWMGVSVETADYLHRVDVLRTIPAALRFLSLEPLLGPVEGLTLDGPGWVIVGGESGPESRPMEASWVRAIRDRCVSAGVPFFFKQWGGRNKKKAGCALDGREWKEWPEVGNVHKVRNVRNVANGNVADNGNHTERGLPHEPGDTPCEETP